MDPYKIIKHPYISEKSVAMIEKENKIIFVVSRNANKKDIKEAMEKVFDVKVEKINTMITPQGEKRAFIKLRPEFKALDVATKMGMV